MKFSDIFVPKYMHSVPEVRIKAVNKLTDKKLLAQIAEKDVHEAVRDAASERLESLESVHETA